ncbi:hypothetical protein [Polaribacter sp.]|jgi:hypothetical protein|uniref:hypothetical protein n=1 Tax=Polaribacter sp. TaxID=1920175 RepID=UPI003F69C1AD
MKNTKEQFIELKRTLNKTLNELLESHHLTYGKDRVITNRWYMERINSIYGQIDSLVEKIDSEELIKN